jgi:hypothetical protein
VTSIWATDSGDAWHLLAPIGFPDEAALHELVEQTPELLPLAGSPTLIVLGREVPLGSGYADLLAVEPSGRLVVLEVKLASNAEARRAVIAQILAYAAFLKGTELARLEGQILRQSLSRLGHRTIGAVAESQDQQGAFDETAFSTGLQESLDSGRFRLVLILDDAPTDLVRLVGYLETIAPELLIDLVTVTSYEVNGAKVVVPQRIDPESPAAAQASALPTSASHPISPEEFESEIADAPSEDQLPLRRLFSWARELESEGTIRLFAYRGSSGLTTLLPYLATEDAGLITIWNDVRSDRRFSVSFWRSVFERRAPGSIERIERLIAPTTLGQGNTTRDASEELLDALASAYREAAI